MPNVKLTNEVYKILLKCQSLLQYRDEKKYSLSDVVAYLLENAPEIRLPLSEGLRVELDEEKEKSG